MGGNHFTIQEDVLDIDRMEYDPLRGFWSPSRRLVAVWDDRGVDMFRLPTSQVPQIQPGAIALVIENQIPPQQAQVSSLLHNPFDFP